MIRTVNHLANTATHGEFVAVNPINSEDWLGRNTSNFVFEQIQINSNQTGKGLENYINVPIVELFTIDDKYAPHRYNTHTPIIDYLTTE